ncbi:orotidine 5'-phosphate decarboxylase / HUMPS family protein [Sulfuracidifex metallicus]|uniref:orotidine 5'-phosphate decarboxylase / HUMPS family protein n=1 Tax=Sulfuracidifex metallicus TaxID=47303 RepID=UPI002273B798|nr:orotidine 5'-phosphate decarboxylase / HUMPS family protein [Sulfuracidifex metallicus]MCY0849310.1 orotidine 5'-phosphate decarboxylase [Sulfuracidifex metallicus]
MKKDIFEKIKSRKNLQVALDFIDINDALKVAEASSRAGANIIEVGTPLVKASGIEGMKKVREVVKDKIMLADMKTADAGDVEVIIANNANANIMTVLGIMDDSTIKSAVEKASELGMLVQADLINVKNVVCRAKQLKSLGVDIVGLHVGLDVQKTRGTSVVDMKGEIKEISELGVLISVAGGLNKERISMLLDLPINIFVVGGAITRSKDPYTSTLDIVNIINGN